MIKTVAAIAAVAVVIAAGMLAYAFLRTPEAASGPIAAVPITIDMTATAISDTRIEGVAATAFPYADFELAIPNVEAVDAVEDGVQVRSAKSAANRWMDCQKLAGAPIFIAGRSQ